jgi:tRNA (guanine-N7-)-methyltransferase
VDHETRLIAFLFSALSPILFPMALRPNLDPQHFLLNIPDQAGRIAWREIFANDHPVELEIGAGKGTFLVAIAQAKPEHNFVGIEYAKAYADFAADRFRRRGLDNARLVHAEASWWIRCHVPDASLAAVHIYFPDPWPKTRHHKRRLIQLPFLKEVHRILVPGGKLRLVTDHADYFAHMQQMLAGQTDLKVVEFDSPVPVDSNAPAPPPGSPAPLVGTNFERKYIAEGRSFNATAAIKSA